LGGWAERGGETSEKKNFGSNNLTPDVKMTHSFFCDSGPMTQSNFSGVHGCNELNISVLRRAIHAHAVWSVVPCCIREGMEGAGRFEDLNVEF